MCTVSLNLNNACMHTHACTHMCQCNFHQAHLQVIYRIAGNFDGGNFDIFDAFQPDRQNLTRQIFKVMHHLVKDSDHPSKYFSSNI